MEPGAPGESALGVLLAVQGPVSVHRAWASQEGQEVVVELQMPLGAGMAARQAPPQLEPIDR